MKNEDVFMEAMEKINLNAQRLNLYAEVFRLQKEGKLNSTNAKKLIVSGLKEIDAGKRFIIKHESVKNYVEREVAKLVDKI